MPEAIRVAVFWAAMVLIAAHLGLALAAAAIPCITSLVGLRQAKRLKIFIDKFGQQASTFALLGGLWVFVVLCAALVALHFLLPATAPSFLGLPLPLAAWAGPLLAGGAAFLAYRGLWQRLKAKKARHAVVGLSASLLLWLAFYAALAAARPLQVGLPPDTGPAFLLPPADSLFWRLLAEGLLLSLGLAGVFTGAWLVWRRDKDDFGRDYYNFTMRLAARIGFAALLASVAAMAWLGLGLLPVVGELSSRLTVAVGLYGTGMLLALVCLGVVMPKENALRHKVLLAAAFLATLVALTGLCAGLAAIFAPGFLPPPLA
ncbi:hypothetical protein DFW101_3283 [Solidesulfovibrio carbinoliphilus subsp. oakridgensis]|uniref:Uncharacterized protein n=1 Tax=Solidesulfovibrio carbinoliphilus subsp. oakridgensis TaxID=694327 RepID=G7QAQ1_9BACT|nr:hypothetical protein [Solidesulfovibrio carbinoliphilus]EHJ49282.1 hypothetical protein DFW101_3283 [Solidesulfovibrio carbinoliphilus subsp. oakridgensis]